MWSHLYIWCYVTNSSLLFSSKEILLQVEAQHKKLQTSSNVKFICIRGGDTATTLFSRAVGWKSESRLAKVLFGYLSSPYSESTGVWINIMEYGSYTSLNPNTDLCVAGSWGLTLPQGAAKSSQLPGHQCSSSPHTCCGSA